MTVVSPLGYRFPGGTYMIAHWENWLLTDCTTAEPLPDDLAHPVALFHVQILGAGTSITELFEVCGAEGPGSVGIDGYDWEYLRPLRVGVEYRMEGGIVRWEQLVDERGNPYDSMSFSIKCSMSKVWRHVSPTPGAFVDVSPKVSLGRRHEGRRSTSRVRGAVSRPRAHENNGRSFARPVSSALGS